MSPRALCSVCVSLSPLACKCLIRLLALLWKLTSCSATHFPEQIQGRNPQTTGASEPDRGREEACGSDAAAAAGVGAVPVLRRPAQEAGVGAGADAKPGDPGAGGADRRERSVLLLGAPQPRAAGRVRRPAAEERGGA